MSYQPPEKHLAIAIAAFAYVETLRRPLPGDLVIDIIEHELKKAGRDITALDPTLTKGAVIMEARLETAAALSDLLWHVNRAGKAVTWRKDAPEPVRPEPAPVHVVPIAHMMGA